MTSLATLVTGRGIAQTDFTAHFYNSSDLVDFAFSKPYSAPIDFSLWCGGESWPYAGCELDSALADGSSYSVQWVGQLLAPTAGSYTFWLNYHDDGVRLFIDDELVTDSGWNNPHPDTRPDPQTITLSAGWHSLRVDYEQRLPSGAALQLQWSGPGFVREVIPLTTGTPLLTLKITDARGEPVTGLRLNRDGWPSLNFGSSQIANPLRVTASMTAASNGNGALQVDLSSINGVSRFYAWREGEIENTLCDDNNTGNSYTQYRSRCAQGLAVAHWLVWVQPSTAASLRVRASLMPNAPGDPLATFISSVAIPQAAIHPVVFLPGLGATNPPVYYTNYRDKGAVDRLLTLGNFAGRYRDFYAALERLGYERNKTYFLFPYDWLVTTQYTARKLREDLLKPVSSDLINSVPYVRTYFQPDNTQQVKFDLIGHSTGNLVARSYIQTDEWAGYVRRFVSIAGPHKGLPKGYTMFEGVGEEDNTPFVCNVTKDIACLAYYWAAPLAEKVGYARRVCLSGGACFTSWNDEERYLFIHDPIWDRRDGQSWPGSVTGFLPTYTEFPYLVDTNGSAYKYGRLLNPLLETVDERGMHTKVIGGATVQVMQFDPYGDNPYVMANLLRRYNATSYTSNYHGLNSPEKMDLLNRRIGDTTSNNVCLIYAGGRGLLSGGGDFPQVVDADWSSTIDTRVQVQVSEPSYFAPYWFTGMRDSLASDRYGLGDRFIPAVSAGPADIWVGSLRGDYDIEKEVNNLDPQLTVNHGDLVGYGITHKYVAQCLLGSAPAFLATTPSGKAPEAPPGYQAQNRTVGVASLQTSASLQATPDSSFLNRALMVTASGPVELTLTDAQGRRLGYNSAGDVYLEIPNGNYVADTDRGLKYLLAWSPEVGSATLTLTGSSDGDYKVMVWYRDTSGQVSLMHLEGQIASGIVVNQALVIPVEARTVPQPPEVVVGADLTAQVGQLVALTGRIKDINPGDAHTVGWDFGDGQTAAGSVTASHTYLAAGTFTATLTVTDTTGFVVSDALQVVVSGSRPPLVIEAGNDQTGSQGQVLTFTATLTDPLSLPGTAIAWNFGDGATSAGALTATHAYSAPGVYTVTVTANATDGRQASDALRVTITSGVAQPVRPVLECVVQNSSTSYTAWFGYKNDNPVAVTIPVGSTNKFTPNLQNRGQTTVFRPGRQVRVFAVLFDGNNLVWTLAGRTSTASRNSARCP